jgi:hypothetical protein
MLIIKLFVQPAYTCRVLNLKLSEYYGKVFLPVILLSSGMCVLFWLAVRGLILPSYLNILALSCLGAVLFAAVAYEVGFTAAEKNYIRNGFGLSPLVKHP